MASQRQGVRLGAREHDVPGVHHHGNATRVDGEFGHFEDRGRDGLVSDAVPYAELEGV